MKRILFVDDEPRILEGLRRMLRGQRRVWSVEFAAGGADAIAWLNRSACDVVVTDMRMPAVDGVEVLEHARRKHPAAVRLILSGHTDRSDSARAIAVAHQFIVKPSSADAVRGTIERVCASSASVPEEVRAFVGSCLSAPVLRENEAALRNALSVSEPSHEVLVRIVGSDAGIAARVLQAVNSSFFGSCRPVSQIAAAVRLLGAPLMREFLTPGSLRIIEDGAATTGGVRPLAERARARAEAAGSVDSCGASGTRYAAALLADLGKLVLHAGCTLPETDARDARVGGAHNDPAADLTRYLLGLWNLPVCLGLAVSDGEAETGLVTKGGRPVPAPLPIAFT